MSYCPKCRYEFEPKVMVCTDCNETLVDQLPTTQTAAVSPDQSWITVGSVSSSVKADLAKGSLDSNNIPSVVMSSTFNAYGKGLDFTAGITLSDNEKNIIMVPREYHDEAMLILEAVLGEDYEQPGLI